MAGDKQDNPGQWIGRSETREDLIVPWPARALAATLGDASAGFADGDALPQAWHWLYFLDAQPPSALGPDGHPARGGFLPPVPLPRRMWAGGRMRFDHPLRIGERARKVSTIASVEQKSGRSGELVFVTVRHEISAGGRTAIVDEQDLVYRGAAAAGDKRPAGEPAPAAAAWRQDCRADPVMLFRYSALTFNGHRIHYDRPYAMHEEHYAGLVVHGPLQATLLLDLARRNAAQAVRTFQYRAMQPIFDGAAFTVNGNPRAEGAELWTASDEGSIAMKASAGY